IKKTGNKITFYINDKEVYVAPSYPFLGQYIGLLVGQNSKISVDYLQVNAEKRTINLLGRGISKYSKKNMGLNINSPYSEIAPVISPDGNTLWIARANHPLNEKPISKYDIWYSTKNSKGVWQKMKKAPKPLNNSGDNVVISVTPDNNTLFLETLYNSDGSFKSDQGISVSYRTATGWTIPKKINVKNFYNKNIYESYAFTGDRKVLVMSVERDDSYGDKDMYVSFLQPDGSYSEPKNMGNVLNSYLGEGTPYIAPDNKTLYFYSMTEPGYGDADIFVSKRLDDTWTKWSKPKNLGKKINSNQWDVYYTVAAKGDYAYLVSSKSSFGNEDIFTIKLRDEEKPDPVVIIYGKVLDAKTKRPISASVIYENSKTGKIEGYARSNPKNGEYKIVLTYGEKYNIRAKKDGYFAMNETINLKQKKNYKEIKKDLLMAPLKKEQPILLKDVNFYSTKAKLLPSAYPELNRLINLMKKNKNIVIELHGHTEQRAGYEKQLYKLSEQRAEAVKKYMISKGIDSKRIKMKAFGGTKPLFSNNTEAGREKNRRVEFKIIQK
ncbi:MAG: OmpA family protein, partial [Chlorobi bacterium]|nr:OmpA family protein [Chlorobiota bacterium]